ncbi:hypothetical protein AB833_21335 [Chromatiales bacterium (ex Bugula neritina AB1)]|nr:hypothetical protein AB833_21335 [Chromatiales bacterium (ex Bugula neritina AB1)]
MIDKHIDAESFIESSSSFHQRGIDKEGKSYKQRSHRELISVFFNFIDQASVTTALEIGAFQAEMSRRFVNSAHSRKALAVEANPYNFDKFKHQLQAEGIIYHHAAVLDQDGPCELQLHVTDLDIKNGYIRGNNSILESDARPHTKAVTVPGTTLDSLLGNYVKSNSFPDPVTSHPVLWIDVEGALDLVIKGGSQTISNSRLIFAEVETQQLWNNQATFSDITALLDPLGFFPYLRDCEYEPEQFNVIFAHRNYTDTALLEKLASGYSGALQAAA